MNISAILLKWYERNKRDLPWRNTNDPYIIWLSEIILQQTRVEQGLPYFQKFSEEFPTIKHFSEAQEDKILKMWQGLGYYSRARNMHHTANEIVKNHQGCFPGEYTGLKKLKGIGDYTAAAIASFAFGKPHAVVEGNVHRFLSRYFGIKLLVDSSKGKKKFQALADELLDKKKPGMHNQAMMEFGAMQCKPANPDCINCVLNTDCFAFNKKKVNILPLKSKSKKVKARYFHYFFIKKKNIIFLNKRIANDIWKNLYEFPLIETSEDFFKSKPSGTQPRSLNQLMKTKNWQNIFGTSDLHIHSVSPDYTHKLSHQLIHARFYEIEIKARGSGFLKSNYISTEAEELNKYGIPRLIERFLIQKSTGNKNKALNIKL